MQWSHSWLASILRSIHTAAGDTSRGCTSVASADRGMGGSWIRVAALAGDGGPEPLPPPPPSPLGDVGGMRDGRAAAMSSSMVKSGQVSSVAQGLSSVFPSTDTKIDKQITPKFFPPLALPAAEADGAGR